MVKQIRAIVDDSDDDNKSSIRSIPDTSEDEQQSYPMHFGKSSLEEIANSPGVNLVLGAGDAIRNAMANVANLGLKPFGKEIAPVQSSEGGAYTAGNIGGNIAAFMGGGELAESLPLIGKVASMMGNTGLGGALKRALGSSAYGAIQSPENRTEGALLGAGGSLAADVAPALLKGGASYFQPQKYAEQIVDKLGGGQSLQENYKMIADKIKQNYKSAKNEAKNLYDMVFNRDSDFSNRRIYREINPSGIHSITERPEIELKTSDSKLNKLFDEFDKRPTFENAHKLQSQLGYKMRSIIPGTPEASDILHYGEVRDQIKDDIDSFLKRENPDLAKQYNDASEHYLENIAPYLNNKKIKSIATKKNFDLKNIPSLFKQSTPDVLKVANDLGEEGKNRVLYSVLGHNKQTVTPESLVKKLNDFDKQGLTDLITPSASKEFQTLSSRIKARNFAQRAGGALSAMAIAKGIKIPNTEILAGLIGGMKGPEVMANLPHMENNNLSQALPKVTSRGYGLTRQALLANLLQGRQ